MACVTKKILAWHFCKGMKLRDGTPLKVGKTYTHKGPVEMCFSGLHASRHVIDALKYAPGTTLCRVECKDIVTEYNDKFVCRSRKVLWAMNVRVLLHIFACDVAMAALGFVGLTKKSDSTFWSAIEAKLAWLDGDVDGVVLAKARDAARDAATVGRYASSLAAAHDVALVAVKKDALTAAQESVWNCLLAASIEHMGSGKFSSMVIATRELMNDLLEERVMEQKRLESK